MKKKRDKEKDSKREKLKYVERKKWGKGEEKKTHEVKGQHYNIPNSKKLSKKGRTILSSHLSVKFTMSSLSIILHKG